jgi:hypothetical protein
MVAIGGRFDILVTMDRSLQYQKNLTGRQFAIVVLRAKTNRIVDIRALVPALRLQLPTCMASNCYEVSA